MTRPIGILIAALAAAGLAVAQQQAVPLSAASLGGGVYWVKGGSGANTGFIVGAREVVAIDAKMNAESVQAVLAAVREATPNPLKRVILTHSDGDHVNGLAGFAAGIAIVAHANCAGDMKTARLSNLPSDTLTGNRRLAFEGVRIELLHFGPAHTNGDLVVWLPERKVAFIGDLAFIGRDPLIHRQKGGTSFGYVQTLRRLLELDADTYISGHADPLTKSDLRGLADSIEATQAKVKALMGEGKSLDEIKAAFGITAQPGQQQRRPSFLEIVHQELSEAK